MTNIEPDSPAQRSGPHPDEVIARLARPQRGVVGRWQLLALGLTRHEIGDRIASGHLILVHRGVYAAGHAALHAGSRRFAAVLAAGREAVISHRTAADEWNLRPDNRHTIDVTSPRRVRARKGVHVHQGRLMPEDIRRLGGLPVTNWPRTLLDLAAERPIPEITRLLERADKLDLLDTGALDDIGERNNGHHGVGNLNRARELFDPRHRQTRSDLERDALPAIDALGLLRPEINARLGPHTVDLYWRAARLVVELDSWEHHRDRTAFESDRARDRWLATRGIACLRLTWRQLHAGGLRDVARILRRVQAA